MTTTDTTSSTYYSQFSPQKKAKGLVYYQDRIEELQQSPQLAIYSQSPMKSLAHQDTTTKVEVGYDLFGEEETHMVVKEEVGKKTRKSRNASAKKEEVEGKAEGIAPATVSMKEAVTITKRIAKKRKVIEEGTTKEEKQSNVKGEEIKKRRSIENTRITTEEEDVQHSGQSGGMGARAKKKPITEIVQITTTTSATTAIRRSRRNTSSSQ
jgi:hypothetical protein